MHLLLDSLWLYIKILMKANCHYSLCFAYFLGQAVECEGEKRLREESEIDDIENQEFVSDNKQTKTSPSSSSVQMMSDKQQISDDSSCNSIVGLRNSCSSSPVITHSKQPVCILSFLLMLFFYINYVLFYSLILF